jgi:hypothetical protein
LTQSLLDLTQPRDASPSARWHSRRVLLEATWRDLVSLVVSLVAGCAIWRTTQFLMTHAATEAHMRRGAPATKQPSRNYERLPARVCHPSASALQVLALQDLALDARAALRHSVGTPIPVCHITRSLIRKHRLYAQRKKDDWLRRSRNTPFVAQYSNPKRLDLESILRARFAP